MSAPAIPAEPDQIALRILPGLIQGLGQHLRGKGVAQAENPDFEHHEQPSTL